MNNYRDYRGFTDKINDIIDDALRTMDFGGLDSDINSTMRQAMRDDIKLSHDDENDGNEGWMHRAQRQSAEQTSSGSELIPVAKKPPGTFSGIIMIVAGSLSTALFGIADFISLGLGSITPLNTLAPTIALSACTAASVGVILGGVSLRRRLHRFREYLEAMAGDEFCEIKNIAEKCARSVKATVRDLKKMIELRMFKEGHLDDTEQWFIGNDDMYHRYVEARENARNRQEADREEAARRAGESEDERRLRMVLERGEESVRQLREANAAMTGGNVSRQLDELENLVSKIFKRVAEKPALLPDIRKFMDYYLPTTLKLVNVYGELESRQVNSEQAENAKRDIEQTLETIHQAFEQLLNELYEDEVMDVSADISVLKSMFARDGLTGSDFKKSEHE
ncbi:MAG: 5-bromo-4-chloroindolyl phosphate hydrolysis family protein [Anaerovoracaceae bacterium]|jgi:5-bromo-4-chloroindolyl phosphate hydrolysis protein